MMLLEDGCCEAPGDRRLPVTFQKRQVCNQRQDSGGWGGVGGSGCYQSGWAVLATGEAEEASIPSLPLCLLSTLALAHSFIQKTLSSDGPDNQDTLRRRGVGYMEVSMTWYHPLKGWLVGAYVCTYVSVSRLAILPYILLNTFNNFMSQVFLIMIHRRGTSNSEKWNIMASAHRLIFGGPHLALCCFPILLSRRSRSWVILFQIPQAML